MHQHRQKNKRVVIVGAGFAGLWAARKLAQASQVETVVIDKNNYHTFPPLLYQVAAAEVEAEAIAYPLRGIFREQANVSTVLAEVTGLDPVAKIVHTDSADFRYDYLLLAAGSLTSFFNTPGAEEYAFTLKTLEDAMRLRNHLLCCFEHASVRAEFSAAMDNPLLNIVVVGGGPTGVEYAGALAELLHKPLARDFPEFPPGAARVTLLDAMDDVLPGLPDKLRRYARKRLERMDVRVRVNARVAGVEPLAVVLADGTRLPTATVVWTAGVRGHDVAGAMGLPLGRNNRVEVLPTLQVAEYPEIFVAGDIAAVRDQNPPMVAPAAIQQGELAAGNILRSMDGKILEPFAYHDKGSMATIGRNAAVAKLGRFSFSGFVAWMLWLFVHLSFLIGFRNRVVVMIGWAWDYLFAERSVRIILPRKIMGKQYDDGRPGC